MLLSEFFVTEDYEKINQAEILLLDLEYLTVETHRKTTENKIDDFKF